jgi:protein gp37
MAENTKIEWTDHTFNPWIGCTKVGPGCDHCYAENLMDTRMGVAVWGPGNSRVRTKEANWKMPLRWNAQADAFMAQHGRRQRVFCASLADVFDNEVPVEWRRDLLDLIAATPNLDWLLLTKRIGNAQRLHAEAYLDSARPWPENVWLGATIVNQAEADRDIPKLLEVPARVRFLSMEPLLGPVELNGHEYSLALGLGEGIDWLTGHISQHSSIFGGHTAPWTTRDCYEFPKDAREPRVHWVIVGGESGPGARPMHPDWARSMRDQCKAAGVPFLFKQWGEWMPTIRDGDTVKLVFEKGAPHGPDQPAFHEWPDGTGAARVGKKAAGRLLDGRTWDGFPAL